MSSGDVFSDNLTFNHQGRHTQRELFEVRSNPTDNDFPFYNGGYRIISRANRILDNINNIPKSAERDRIQSEALTIRAFTHFDIARVYCKIPTQSADAKTSLGIYYSEKFEPEVRARRKGTTVDGVYQKIIRDLTEAENLIGDFKEQGRLNKQAINGLLARVYLHYGDYAKAVEHADKALSGFEITPRTEVANLWKDAYDKSVLFKIVITDKDDIAIGNTYGQADSRGNRAEFVCSYDLYQLYKDSDIRKTTTILTGDYRGKTYNSVAKYFGKTTGTKNLNDGKYLRVEEVYLTKAEALYRLGGNESEALKALDEVRKNRYENFVSGTESGDVLLEAILLERRLELAFEGDRFFTLKRLGLSLQRSDKGEFADGTGTPPLVLTYPADGFRWQLPIPRSAIDANPELAADQNSGYEN
nr:RagB/SusD family nutrient uptake outer membrane protein [Capnocytophaga cynodegmi]